MNTIRLFLLLLFGFILLTAASTLVSTTPKFKGVQSSIILKADQKTVYNAIRSLRDKPNSGVREVEAGSNYAIVEEVFEGLPIINKAVCRYKEVYTPYQRIEYYMIKSDKFKAFKGCWQITPLQSGSGCTVQLSSYIDTGLHIPFAGQITNTKTLHDIKTRLTKVKIAVESRSNITTK